MVFIGKKLSILKKKNLIGVKMQRYLKSRHVVTIAATSIYNTNVTAYSARCSYRVVPTAAFLPRVYVRYLYSKQSIELTAVIVTEGTFWRDNSSWMSL
jgi:hypothetical protein